MGEICNFVYDNWFILTVDLPIVFKAFNVSDSPRNVFTRA